MYKIIIVIMIILVAICFFLYNLECTFWDIYKFCCKNIIIYFFVELIVTKWPYVNCIVWIMWLIFSYVTSTIGLYVLDFLRSSNALVLVHFECMYQQMKLLGCIQVTNRCRVNSCKFKHPHIILWMFKVHLNHQ